MSLTNRVSTFFLVALGIILVVYSSVFYAVTRKHIDAQFESELRGVLSSLIAAAEVEETEVKWQPLEHSIDYGTNDEFGEVQWAVVGDQELIVEQSRYAADSFLAEAKRYAASGLATTTSTPVRTSTTSGSGEMAMMSQHLAAPRPLPIDRELDEFDELAIVVGRSTGPRDSILLRLTLLVTLLPLLAWCTAAFLGRWFVRQALRPVSAMADQAKGIMGNDFQSRLPQGDTGDELSELGASFNLLLDRQQAAMEQQRRFAGDAAHELRTPLTVLMGQIDVTLRRPRSVSEYQSNLELLRGQTQTLQEIVESLLFLARSHTEPESVATNLVNLKQWLRTHALTWSTHPRFSDIRLDDQLNENSCAAANPVLLERVIDNLVFNALKYSESGTPVTVSASESKDRVQIQVIDAGPGIHEADLKQLFDPFFRSREARRRGIAGTGLGLALANRIAATLGGSLKCESTVGKGSCFSLRLRRVEERIE
ncbi:MAG: HAMP domain-containing sensor histidine kinase [Pirellulaceae bacterium]